MLQSTSPGAAIERLAGVEGPITLADLNPGGKAAHVDRGSAVGGSTIAAGEDLDHVELDIRAAQPWLQEVADVFAAPWSEADGALAALHERAPDRSFQQGALAWLHRAAAALHSQQEEGGGNPLIGLRRVASVLLPRLSLELGDRWFDQLSDEERIRLPASLLHELETGASRQDLRRGLDLLRRFEPMSHPRAESTIAKIGEHVADADPEDPDRDGRVDARMLTVDEYEQAQNLIRDGVVPPLTVDERSTLEDLLELLVWSVARPREVLEARRRLARRASAFR
jgi:hypothetical protein